MLTAPQTTERTERATTAAPRMRRGPTDAVRLIAKYCGSRMHCHGIGYDIFHVLSPAVRNHRFKENELFSEEALSEDDGSGIDVRFEAEVYRSIGKEITPVLEAMEEQSGGAPVEGSLPWTLGAEQLPSCVVELLVERPNRLGETILPDPVVQPLNPTDTEPSWTPFATRCFAKKRTGIFPFQDADDSVVAKAIAVARRLWRCMATPIPLSRSRLGHLHHTPDSSDVV